MMGLRGSQDCIREHCKPGKLYPSSTIVVKTPERKQTLTMHCRWVRPAVQSVSQSNTVMSSTIAQNSVFTSYNMPIILPKPWIDSFTL